MARKKKIEEVVVEPTILEEDFMNIPETVVEEKQLKIEEVKIVEQPKEEKKEPKKEIRKTMQFTPIGPKIVYTERYI